MKREKLIKYLKKHNCETYREGKRHTIFINRNNNQLTAVPRHTDVNDKLILSICKDLDIPKVQTH